MKKVIKKIIDHNSKKFVASFLNAFGLWLEIIKDWLFPSFLIILISALVVLRSNPDKGSSKIIKSLLLIKVAAIALFDDYLW